MDKRESYLQVGCQITDRLDIGFLPSEEADLPVERIANTYPQIYPQEDLFLIQSTSWRSSKSMPIYGGMV